MEQARRFYDFAEPNGPLDGEKVKIESVLNIEILITAFRIKQSKYQQSAPECITIQFEYTDKPSEHHVIFSGSAVLCDQLRKYEEHLPFLTTIKKVERFFTLT